jgi:FlaA1/EpsC-like NDP-sugar epimerase
LAPRRPGRQAAPPPQEERAHLWRRLGRPAARKRLCRRPDTRIVGFVDDHKDLQGSRIQGVRVWGSDRLADLVDELTVSEVYLAIPSASRRRNEILQQIRKLAVAVRTLPGLMDLVHGKVTVNDLRPLEIEDLLGREAVKPDEALLRRNIENKVVLVTGAGGSIGGELCRQIQAMDPSILLLVDVSEYALYAIHRELERLRPPEEPDAPELVPLIASVCDEGRMRRILASWRPQTVYHAAAYKHVPLVEHNVVEGVRNNVLGTYTCARLACEHNVADFVLISTDKAVRPTNIMGATKRLAEMALQAIAELSPATRFSMGASAMCWAPAARSFPCSGSRSRPAAR